MLFLDIKIKTFLLPSLLSFLINGGRNACRYGTGENALPIFGLCFLQGRGKKWQGGGEEIMISKDCNHTADPGD